MARNTGKPKDVLLTVGEVADILRLHWRTVYRLIQDGRLPGKRIPTDSAPRVAKRNPIRVRESDLYKWLENVGPRGVADVRDRRRKTND